LQRISDVEETAEKTTTINDEINRAFQVKDLQGAFFILVIGCIGSVFTFTIEQIYYKQFEHK
jgi:hypothetical protein